jgi:hypothetical protein
MFLGIESYAQSCHRLREPSTNDNFRIFPPKISRQKFCAKKSPEDRSGKCEMEVFLYRLAAEMFVLPSFFVL